MPSPGLPIDLSREGGSGDEPSRGVLAPERVAPTLIFAVGNLSRGDDAVGPLLADRLLAEALSGIDVLVDFQLQVEHALDLEGRSRVIFVDACVDTEAPCVVRALEADGGFAHTSHALAPAQVLETYRRVTGHEPPPAWLLGVRAQRFELGEGLSAEAARACEAAWPKLLELCGGAPTTS